MPMSYSATMIMKAVYPCNPPDLVTNVTGRLLFRRISFVRKISHGMPKKELYESAYEAGASQFRALVMRL